MRGKMKFFLSLVFLVSFIGCEKDPYPENGGVREEPRGEQREIPPTLSLTNEKTYEFDEGKKRSIKIGVFAQPPGKPDLVVKNLPEGAEFDPETFTINWTPGPFQGNDISDPTKKTRVYTIELLLRNTLDLDGETRTANVSFIVNDVPRDFDINGRDTDSVREGSKLEYIFDIDNIDYPQGPFAVNTADLPPNTKLEKVSETRYKLVFEPDYHHVKINQVNEVEYAAKISVYNPANHLTEKTVDITVRDVRRSVKVVPPPTMEQGLDTTFQVSAYDENGEIAPDISLVSSVPEFGEWSSEIVKDEVNNSSVLNVTWSDIPPNYNGQNIPFEFEACVLSSRYSRRNCKRAQTTLKIRVKERKPPYFNRTAWEAGEVKFLKHNESKTFYISAFDGDNRVELDSLKVVPQEMQKFVTWRNGRVTVKCDELGLKQFSIVANSEYNMSTAESFVFEVFGENRSEIIYFTDSTRVDEVKFFQQNLTNVELMNPAIQLLSDRTLAGRETLVLGTSALIDTHFEKEIIRGLASVKNVIIATPMFENLPKDFKTMIENELKIRVVGRYSELPTQADLSNLSFVARPDFSAAQGVISLKGTSTRGISDNPVFFHESVRADRCDDVLEVEDNIATPRASYSIGIICTMPNGGRLALLGTEFADIKGVGVDENIASRWFNDMLNKRTNR